MKFIISIFHRLTMSKIDRETLAAAQARRQRRNPKNRFRPTDTFRH